MAYAEALNGLSDKEWESLKMPPVTTISQSSNRQLAALDYPHYKQPTVEKIGPSVCRVATSFQVEDVPNRGLVGEGAQDVPRQCHMECFPGLGGELVCLHGDGDLDVTQTVAPPVLVYSQTNTPASERISWSSQGEVRTCTSFPPSHQVGSTPDGKSPPPGFGFNLRNEISVGTVCCP